MPGFHVNDFKSNINSLARAYLFNIGFKNAPVGVVGGENKAAYLVRSSSTPESTIEAIEVPGQGQTYKIGSTHTFSEGTCTFNVDDEAQLVRNMNEWAKLIHNPDTNVQGDPSNYLGEAVIEMLNTNGEPILQYELHQIGPSAVGAIDLAQDSKEVSQCEVTFTYQWFTIK